MNQLNIFVLIPMFVVFAAYIIYYFKVGVTNKLTYLFLFLEMILSFIVNGMVGFTVLIIMVSLFFRDYGNRVSFVLPIIVLVIIYVISVFANYVLTQKVDISNIIELVYIIPSLLIYRIELSYVVYKEDIENA